jgi:carbon monoxide dehydrogenase subunit G
MHITGTYSFAALPAAVWDLLMDTRAIAACLPGCRELRDLGDDLYTAELNVAVAAVSGHYGATIAIKDKIPPTSYRLAIEASGRMGFVKGEARVTLAEKDGQTTVAVDATADVGGAVARVGQRLIEGVARMTMDRFFACLAGKLSAT